MYRIDLIGAMVYDQNGDMIGLITSIEDRAEGPCVNITDGEDPRAKEPVPEPVETGGNSNFGKLREVQKGV